jgi:hypothetical protein
VAQKVIVELVDDLDGSNAAETVTFGLDGTMYEVDLNKKNAVKLRSALTGYIEVARTTKPSRPKAVNGRPDAKKVRQWAQANKVKVPAKGRIPQAVLSQYAAAN